MTATAAALIFKITLIFTDLHMTKMINTRRIEINKMVPLISEQSVVKI